jgi:hypothetical protein
MLETLKNAVNEIGLGNKSEVTPTPAHPRWDPERKMMCLVGLIFVIINRLVSENFCWNLLIQ